MLGFIVNRMRGDPSLFADGMRFDRRSAPAGRRSAWCRSFPRRGCCRPRMRWICARCERRPGGAQLRIAVPVLPHIANFDDLDPLRAEPDVELVLVQPRHAAAGAVRSGDPARLEGDDRRSRSLRAEGWDIDIAAHRRRGGRVLGLCGGYQMLGEQHRRSRRHRGAAGTRRRVSGCSMSTRC